MIKLFLFFSFLSFLLLTSWIPKTGEVSPSDPSNVSVEQMELALGGDKKSFFLATFDPQKAELGEQLIRKGWVKKGIRRSKMISPYFVCADCHNLSPEFENNTTQSAKDRLEFSKRNNLKYLPASTFWGIYNRSTFYNDDYVKKYGNEIDKAKNSLPDAIQVCAKYCSSGRTLNKWELEAILHYYKKHELKMADLQLDQSFYNSLVNPEILTDLEKKEKLTKIQSSYIQGYSATFLETMPKEKRKFGVGANAKNGEFIFNTACLHCHLDGRVTNLKLDTDKLTGQLFDKNKTNYSDESLYQIVRQGTYAMPGRNQYMPRYTEQKMSDEQLEDLMAYLTELANRK